MSKTKDLAAWRRPHETEQVKDFGVYAPEVERELSEDYTQKPEKDKN